LIAEIDPRTYDALVAQAKADLLNAQSALALSKVTLERDGALLGKQIVAQADYDSAKASCEQAQAMVMIKQATLEQNQANLGYCKITSPTDGVVIARKVDVGQTVIAAMSTPVLFTIVQDLSKMNISAAVSEADIGRVKVGQPVDFTVDAYPDDTFHGTVAQVRKNPTTTQNVVTYEVIISADNPEQKLFPGMTADVSILAAQRTNALEVPNAALRFTPPAQAVFEAAPPAALKRDERLIYVTSADGAKLKAVVVKAGITDGMKTEILDGLTNGAAVVTSTASSAGRNNFGPPPPPPQ
jgi:HlyD family secretion protein